MNKRAERPTFLSIIERITKKIFECRIIDLLSILRE